jgi:Roadblock/LC7 domain
MPEPRQAHADSVPARLVEMSADVRTAVLLDPAGGLIAASDPETERARRLAGLVNDLVLAADGATTTPTEQIEAQVEGGAVFAVRSARHTLACVVRRLALPALILYDLRQTLLELEAAA